METIGKWTAKYYYVTVNEVPTKVLTIGNTNLSTDTVEPLFVFIPGNPGIIEYYEEFLQEIYDNFEGKLHVCGLSHAGHDETPEELQAPSPYANWVLYSLQGQVKHKVEFVRCHVGNERPVFLAGHSIGAYMVLQLLKHQKELKAKRSFLLFPVFERLAETPNGRSFPSGILLKLFTWLVVALLFILPRFVKAALVDRYFKDLRVSLQSRIKNATVTLFTPRVFKLMINMAEEELQQVKQRDDDVIGENITRLTFYYGSQDKWCPFQFYLDMKEAFPCADLNLCVHNLKHAFTLDRTTELARFVSDKIRGSL